MNRIFKRLLWGRRKADSLVTVSISKKNILHNLSEFQKLSGSVAPVLKSNAYGHGILQVAQILENSSVPFFVVDSYYEAHTLRYNDIQKPLLVIGYTSKKVMVENRFKEISFMVTSLESLKELSDLKKNISIHLKIDTGMNRQGILPSELNEALSFISSNSQISLLGVATHFADADNEDKKYSLEQISIWNKCVEIVKGKFPEIKYIHISNTAGHAYINKAISNVSRLGIGLYGIKTGGPIDDMVSLKPAMKVKTIITGIKNISKGSRVGYSGTFVAQKEMKIATIPFGYFEGMDRRLSNKGYVKIGDSFSKIVGRVSMNIATIDVTSKKDIKIGDEVLLISDNSNDKNSIENIARLCSTIPYEISVHIERSLKREVV